MPALLDAHIVGHTYPPKLSSIPTYNDGHGARVAETIEARYRSLLVPRVSQYMIIEDRFSGLRSRLKQVAQYKEGWDSYDALGPTDTAVCHVKTILDELKRANLVPDALEASAEGGVGICFIDGNRYAHLECFNDGEIAGVAYEGQDEPILWETTLENLTASIEIIRDHLSR